jgi:hypothetical protein
MPLRQAIFTFGIAEDGRASELRDKPFSLRELTSTLKEMSGAQEAKISTRGSRLRRYSMRRGSSGSVTKKPHVTANDSEQFGTQPA